MIFWGIFPPVTERCQILFVLFKNNFLKMWNPEEKQTESKEIIGYYMKEIAPKSANMLFLCNGYSES